MDDSQVEKKENDNYDENGAGNLYSRDISFNLDAFRTSSQQQQQPQSEPPINKSQVDITFIDGDTLEIRNNPTIEELTYSEYKIITYKDKERTKRRSIVIVNKDKIGAIELYD